ncbi:hypothetical protein D3C72_802920 [compost metagenome]
MSKIILRSVVIAMPTTADSGKPSTVTVDKTAYLFFEMNSYKKSTVIQVGNSCTLFSKIEIFTECTRIYLITVWG